MIADETPSAVMKHVSDRMSEPDLGAPELYINRELAALELGTPPEENQ